MKMYLLHKMGDFPASKKTAAKGHRLVRPAAVQLLQQKTGGSMFVFCSGTKQTMDTKLCMRCAYINVIVINVSKSSWIEDYWSLMPPSWSSQTFTKTSVIICVRIVWIRSTWVSQTSHCYPKKMSSSAYLQTIPRFLGAFGSFSMPFQNQQPSKWYLNQSSETVSQGENWKTQISGTSNNGCCWAVGAVS